MVLIDIPNNIWKMWKKSREELEVVTDENLIDMLLAEIWEGSWQSLTEDGSFIPYYYLTKNVIESIDIDKLITQYKGKSLNSFVRSLEKELNINYEKLLTTS